MKKYTILFLICVIVVLCFGTGCVTTSNINRYYCRSVVGKNTAPAALNAKKVAIHQEPFDLIYPEYFKRAVSECFITNGYSTFKMFYANQTEKKDFDVVEQDNPVLVAGGASGAASIRREQNSNYTRRIGKTVISTTGNLIPGDADATIYIYSNLQDNAFSFLNLALVDNKSQEVLLNINFENDYAMQMKEFMVILNAILAAHKAGAKDIMLQSYSMDDNWPETSNIVMHFIIDGKPIQVISPYNQGGIR